MANICPVCGEKIGFLNQEWVRIELQKYLLHVWCAREFESQPGKYVGTVKAKAKADIEAAEKKVEEEYVELQQKIEEKSVHVKSFDMPFGDMVGFMVKWALASIPAFIILFIIFGILFLIFGSLFF